MSQKGILVDYQFCTGCFSCEVACQNEHDLHLNQWGVKVLSNGPWPIRDAKTGQETDQFNYDCIPAFTRLCDLCKDRQAQGKQPACVHHCQASCLKFGDVADLVKDLDVKPQQYLWVPPISSKGGEIDNSKNETYAWNVVNAGRAGHSAPRGD